MKYLLRLLVIAGSLFLAGCISSSCPEGAVTYLNPPFPPEISGLSFQPQMVEIDGQEVLVDRVISGTVCNDTWSDTVYLTCDIQVPAWEEDPFFWQDCDLEIEEGAIVYVEAHKDKSYTDGCSCHE